MYHNLYHSATKISQVPLANQKKIPNISLDIFDIFSIYSSLGNLKLSSAASKKG